MPITTDAKTPEDKALAKAMIMRLAGRLADEEVAVKFLKTKVKVEMPDSLADMSRAQFDRWAEAEFPWNDSGPKLVAPKEEADDNFRPQPKQAGAKKGKGRKAPPKRTSTPDEALDAPAPPPRKRAEPKATEPSSDLLNDLIDEAFEIEEEARSGSVGRNAARFKRGELMIRLQGISQASKTPVKKLLTYLNEGTLARASENSIAGFEIITEQEATTVRRVVSAFGSSGEFRHVAGVDPATGAPMTGDDGKPILLPLTEVAVNKLYPLAEYADEVEPDTLLSFAHATTEKVVKKTKNVAKRLERPIQDVISDVVKMRVKKMSPLGEAVGEIEAPADEATVLASLREVAGEAPEPDIATLKTSRAWYDGTWIPLKRLVDAIAQAFMPDRVNEATGQTSNVYILERILTAFYHPAEDAGVQRVLGALVAAEDITEEQANAFIDGFRETEDGWERVNPVEAEDVVSVLDDEPEPVEVDDSDEADDDDFDDFDLDTPPAPEQDEPDEDDEDDDDF